MHQHKASGDRQVDELNVKKAKLFAQNGLRLVVKLMDTHLEWTTREDIGRWFISN